MKNGTHTQVKSRSTITYKKSSFLNRLASTCKYNDTPPCFRARHGLLLPILMVNPTFLIIYWMIVLLFYTHLIPTISAICTCVLPYQSIEKCYERMVFVLQSAFFAYVHILIPSNIRYSFREVDAGFINQTSYYHTLKKYVISWWNPTKVAGNLMDECR